MLEVTPDTYSSLDRFGLLGWLRIRGAGVVQSATAGGAREGAVVPARASITGEPAASGPSPTGVIASVPAAPTLPGETIL